ncbi:hypothetical protein Bca101_035762 [Brassica carinata]
MSNSEKLDKLIQMVRDLDKRVVIIHNVLGVKVSSPNPTFTFSKFDLLSQESHSGKVVGVKFLEEIDEFYDEFLDDKKCFQFGAGFDKYNIEKNINFLYSAIAVAEKYWLGVVVNLEKRSITSFNCAAMKFTDASLVPYVNAYAMALPFMFRNFFRDVSMDTSKFSIKIVSEGFPQVLKIEDSGVYALKLIECHAMRIVDLTKLSEEKIAIIRKKLAVDIFSELQ